MSDAPTSVITRLVAERWPGVTLTDLTHVAGDFSARRYFRAHLRGGGAPTTAVVMVLAGTGLPLSSEELAIFPEPPRELPFLDVHRLLSTIGAPVPEVYLAAVDEGVLLLEDAGDVVLWDRVRAAPTDAERHYRAAIDALLILHERGTAATDRSSIAFQQRFDARLYRWELEHFLEWGIERRLDRRLDDRTRAGLAVSFDAISAELDAAPVVLSHRDYHSWNILMPDDRPTIIDFQDALLATAEYDLATLLTDRTTPRVVTRELEERLLDYYWSRTTRPRGTRRRYALTALHKVLKVVGRVHYIALAKGKPGPLSFLPDVLATARRFLAEVEVPGTLRAEFEALPWPDRP